MKFARVGLIIAALLVTAFAVAAPTAHNVALPGQSVNQFVTTGLGSTDKWTCARSVFLVGELGWAQYASQLQTIANDPARPSFVRMHALLAMGRINDSTGVQFCKDLGAGRGWIKMVRAQVAQRELIGSLAHEVAVGKTSHHAANPNSKAQSYLDLLSNEQINSPDVFHLERLVLLDCKDSEMWVNLADTFNGQPRQKQILALALAINPGDQNVSAALAMIKHNESRASLNGKHLGARQTATCVAVFAKAREKARQS